MWSLSAGPFFIENLMNVAPHISKTRIHIDIRNHTHTLYVYTQDVDRGSAAEQGSCCLRPSCPQRGLRQREETLSGIFYKAVRGRTSRGWGRSTRTLWPEKDITQRLLTVRLRLNVTKSSVSDLPISKTISTNIKQDSLLKLCPCCI